MPQKITSGLTSQAVAESFVFLQLLAFDDACFIHVGRASSAPSFHHTQFG
jgi:hypothetical protein